MTRSEVLKDLDGIYDFLDKMSDDEVFDFFYANSESFRNDVDSVLGEVVVFSQDGAPISIESDRADTAAEYFGYKESGSVYINVNEVSQWLMAA